MFVIVSKRRSDTHWHLRRFSARNETFSPYVALCGNVIGDPLYGRTPEYADMIPADSRYKLCKTCLKIGSKNEPYSLRIAELSG